MRISAESKISECKKFLDQGEINSTPSCLGDIDESIENLRLIFLDKIWTVSI